MVKHIFVRDIIDSSFDKKLDRMLERIQSNGGVILDVKYQMGGASRTEYSAVILYKED